MASAKWIFPDLVIILLCILISPFNTQFKKLITTAKPQGEEVDHKPSDSLLAFNILVDISPDRSGTINQVFLDTSLMEFLYKELTEYDKQNLASEFCKRVKIKN